MHFFIYSESGQNWFCPLRPPTPSYTHTHWKCGLEAHAPCSDNQALNPVYFFLHVQTLLVVSFECILKNVSFNIPLFPLFLHFVFSVILIFYMIFFRASISSTRDEAAWDWARSRNRLGFYQSSGSGSKEKFSLFTNWKKGGGGETCYLRKQECSLSFLKCFTIF